MQRELDGTRAHVCIQRPSIHIDPYAHSYMRTRARARTSAAPPRTTAAHASATDRAQSAAVRAGPEAAHTLDKSVTRAVFHAPMFALKADADSNACNATLGGGVKCSHAVCARPIRTYGERYTHLYAAI